MRERSELYGRVDGDNSTNKVLVLYLLKSCIPYHLCKPLLHSFLFNLGITNRGLKLKNDTI